MGLPALLGKQQVRGDMLQTLVAKNIIKKLFIFKMKAHIQHIDPLCSKFGNRDRWTTDKLDLTMAGDPAHLQEDTQTGLPLATKALNKM